MKCPVKVYIYNHIYPFFDPPMEGLPTLSEAFEECLRDKEWRETIEGAGFVTFKDGEFFTLQVDCKMVRWWYHLSDIRRDALISKFNKYLEALIEAKGGYK